MTTTTHPRCPTCHGHTIPTISPGAGTNQWCPICKGYVQPTPHRIHTKS